MSDQQPPYGNQPPYGQQPGYPPMGGSPQRQVLTKPPQSIRIAQVAMVIGAALSVITIPLATLVQWDEIKANLRETLIEDGTYEPGMVDTVMGIMVLVLVGIGLVLAIVWGLLAWLAGRGAEWSRIVGSTLCGLYVVLALCTMISVPDLWSLASTCALLLCGLVATVFLWMRDSTAWFRQPRV